jgi:hypothetical protein
VAEERERWAAAGPDGAPVAVGPAAWETDGRVAAARAAWRAAAAATADPRWARPGSAAAAGRDGALGADWTPDVPAPGARAACPAGQRRGRWAAAAPAGLAAAAAVLTMVSSTMTWATMRAFGFVEYSVAGMDPTQHGRLTFGLGILVGLAAVGLAARPGGHAARLLATVTGVTGLAIALVALIDIGYLRAGGLFAGSGIEGTTAIGLGLWLVLVGGLLALGAALCARPGRRAARVAADPPAERGAPRAGTAGGHGGTDAPAAAQVPGPPEEDLAGLVPHDPRPGDAETGLMGP